MSEEPLPLYPYREEGWLRYLIPRWMPESLFEVTAERLAALEIRGVILDMDNTLTEWHSGQITAEVLGWIKGLHDQGFRTCVLSNTHREDRLKALCEQLGVDYLLGSKPRRRGFRAAMLKLGTVAEQTAVIGDQIFTDVLGGNRTGLYTILVPPLSKSEFVGTKWISRRLEKILFAFLDRKHRVTRN